jgi:hypothetical protein
VANVVTVVSLYGSTRDRSTERETKPSVPLSRSEFRRNASSPFSTTLGSLSRSESDRGTVSGGRGPLRSVESPPQVPLLAAESGVEHGQAHACAFRAHRRASPWSGDAPVAVMEPADLGNGDDSAIWLAFDDPWVGTVVEGHD